MIHRFLFIIILIVLSVNIHASDNHLSPEKPKKYKWNSTKIQIGGGIARSVLYLSRNVKESNDAMGYACVANYGGTKLLRISAQYSYYKPINIAPTWYTIKANTIEINLELLARFNNNKTFLYPLCGLSYNTFKGYFTGQDDYLNLREHYSVNSTIKNNWMGVNIGTGVEHTIGPIVLFFDYRMRLGASGGKFGNFSILDVCYGGGLRLKLFIPERNGRKNKLYDFGNRYHFF